MIAAMAAAGTGGHVFPALAVADELRRRGWEVVFFGGERIEAGAVPAAGFELVQVPLQGLRRSLSPDNLRLPITVGKAVRLIRTELERRRVDVLVAFGGYVTVPAAWAAYRAGIPIVLHEQNAIPGLANRLTRRWANRVFVAFPEAVHRMPGAAVIGNPLRAGFEGFDREGRRAGARRRYGIPIDARVLGVLGGSQGAVLLNRIATQFAATAPNGTAIVHIAGRRNVAEVTRAAARASVPWTVVDFEEHMEEFYAASDLVLSRAGALTVSELGATATPAVVVPYAAGTAGHQAANAAALAEAGAVRIVPEAEADQVPGVLEELLADAAALRRMRRAAAEAHRPGAARAIADAVAELGR